MRTRSGFRLRPSSHYALDETVDTGALARTRRRNAEWVCWSAVHGFADLATSGPLRGMMDADGLDEFSAQLVAGVVKGIR
ncbi:hypothetical protein STSO111631_06465 [Stackebrandtia soli]